MPSCFICGQNYTEKLCVHLQPYDPKKFKEVMTALCVMCGKDAREGVTDSAGNFECKHCIEREAKARG